MKENFFKRVLRNIDSFGHTVSLNYKGRQTYSTVAGGIITLTIQALTLIMVYRVIHELIAMEQPQVINYEMPITKKDRAEHIPLKFEEFNYIIAVKFWVTHKITHEKTMIPPEVGELIGFSSLKKVDRFSNCTEILTQEMIEESYREDLSFQTDQDIFCLNPKDKQTSYFYNWVGNGPEMYNVVVASCKDLNDWIPGRNVNCLSDAELQDWFENHYVIMVLFEFATIHDLQATENYLHRQMHEIDITSI